MRYAIHRMKSSTVARPARSSFFRKIDGSLSKPFLKVSANSFSESSVIMLASSVTIRTPFCRSFMGATALGDSSTARYLWHRWRSYQIFNMYVYCIPRLYQRKIYFVVMKSVRRFRAWQKNESQNFVVLNVVPNAGCTFYFISGFREIRPAVTIRGIWFEGLHC